MKGYLAPARMAYPEFPLKKNEVSLILENTSLPNNISPGKLASSLTITWCVMAMDPMRKVTATFPVIFISSPLTEFSITLAGLIGALWKGNSFFKQPCLIIVQLDPVSQKMDIFTLLTGISIRGAVSGVDEEATSFLNVDVVGSRWQVGACWYLSGAYWTLPAGDQLVCVWGMTGIA